MVWQGIWGGMNAGSAGSFVPDFGLGVSYVLSHEMSHWTKCVGGDCDYSTNVWMWEGQASYFGQQIRNKLLGLPFFTWKPTLYYSSGFVPDGPTDDPLSKYGLLQDGLQYTKGEHFLFTLGELVGHETMHQVIRNNRGKSISAESFIRDIEKLSGLNLASVKYGWLYDGPYDEQLAPLAGPKFYYDSDGDGLADFQEVIRALNSSNPDTDGDGYSDYWELAKGFNPKSVSSPVRGSVHEWAIDGLPGDYPFKSDPDVQWTSNNVNTPVIISSIKCKRASPTNFFCAIWYIANTAKTLERKAMFGDARMWASCSTAPYNYNSLEIGMSGYGVMDYHYYGPRPQPVEVALIPSTVNGWRSTDYGVEFNITVPGRNVNLYYRNNAAKGQEQGVFIMVP